MNKNTKKILDQIEDEENPAPKKPVPESTPAPAPKKVDFFEKLKKLIGK